MNKIFREKLEELMNEFPEYYIEIWGPDDFYKHNPNLTHEQCENIVFKLRSIYDPTKGTNFKTVEDTVDKITAMNHWENEWDKEHEYELGGSE